MNLKKVGITLSIILLTTTVYCGYEIYTKDQAEIYKQIKKYHEYDLYLERKINGVVEENKKLKLETDKLKEDIETLKDEITKMDTKINNVKKTSSTNTSTSKPKGKTMTFEATAYAGDTITATGTVPKVGRTIAVDPKVIPYGSKVHVEGMGTFIAEDCGGAVKGNIIDIFMSSEAECRKWGRRNVQVTIL